jgi:hypothetical protein
MTCFRKRFLRQGCLSSARAALQCGATPQLPGVPATGAGHGAAVARRHGSATPDATCTSNIEGGLVFGGRSSNLMVINVFNE